VSFLLAKLLSIILTHPLRENPLSHNVRIRIHANGLAFGVVRCAFFLHRALFSL